MVKSTGIVRKVDHLGRIVLPKELRDTHGLPEGTPLEVFVDNGRIILQKYEPGCCLCGGFVGIQVHKTGKLVCHDCKW